MKKSTLSRKFHNDNGYSLIELVVVIAIMVIVVAVMVPMLYNGPSNKTRQDVNTFDSMVGKNAVLSMAQQNRALEIAYDSADGKFHVALGVLTSSTSGGARTYNFTADDTKYFDEDEHIHYVLYSSGSAETKVELAQNRKIYIRLDKTKGNFKPVIITDAANVEQTGDSAKEYVKFVYFTVKDKTRGCRLYRDTGKHDVFKE